MRLSHGWRVWGARRGGLYIVRDFVRPAIRALPSAIVSRLPRCEILLVPQIEGCSVTSRWTLNECSLEITLTTQGVEPHDLALELLVCVGQVLWDALRDTEQRAWLGVLATEIDDDVTGEIDEDALAEKRKLMASAAASRSRRRLEVYARASFAGTAAEYVHALWHDVTVRSGPDYLNARHLRIRLKLLASMFPPDAGYRLFSTERAQ